jgi:hypothetical protein
MVTLLKNNQTAVLRMNVYHPHRPPQEPARGQTNENIPCRSETIRPGRFARVSAARNTPGLNMVSVPHFPLDRKENPPRRC